MKRSSALLVLIVLILATSGVAYAAYPPHIPPGGSVPGPNPNERPVAVITPGLDYCIVDQPCPFYAIESSDSDGYIEYYKWDMEDGTVIHGHVEGLSHIYEVGGWYRVFLLVRDDDDATDMTSYLIEVKPRDNAGGGSDPGEPNYAPSCSFTSPPDGTKYNVSETVTANYKGTDSYYISSYKLEVNSATKKTGSSLGTSFSHSYSKSYSNTGNYTYKLTCYDHKGLTDTDSITIEVVDDGGGGGGNNTTNQAPVAVIDSPNNNAQINQSTTFSIKFHGSDDYQVAKYRLYIDSTKKYEKTGLSVSSFTDSYSHSFANTGSHTIKLEVEDNKGKIGTDSITVNVVSGGGGGNNSTNQPPVASINYPTSSTKVTTGVPITMQLSGSDDSQVDKYYVYIDSSKKYTKLNVNSKSFTDNTFSYTFTSKGSHTIKLEVYDDKGLIGTDTVTVNVVDPPPKITCSDTDGGRNYLKKGTYTVASGSNSDRCHLSEKLYEYWCTTDDDYDNEPHVELVSCSQKAIAAGYDDGYCALGRCWYEKTSDSSASTESESSGSLWSWLMNLLF